MADFSLQASHDFWQAYSDPMVYRAVVFMESIETWTLDGNEALERAIDSFGSVMEDISNLDLQEQERFVQLFACLKMARTLRIMQALDTAYPGAASKLLAYAEDHADSNDLAQLFIQRNVIFERLRLLGRVFSEERIKQLQVVLENG